jgi:UDP-glucose 4-epimerase
MSPKRWLVTGAAGAIGLQVLKRLLQNDFSELEVIASDVRNLPAFIKHPRLHFYKMDVRSKEIFDLIKDGCFHGVIHLASIVTPGKKSQRDFEYSVDVLGTKNILQASRLGGVKHFIVTSSGAAYGYHPDLPEWIDEECPLRGNEIFAYAWHKKCVEQMLAEYRNSTPEMTQLVLRPGAVLGDMIKNQITDLFEKPVVLGVLGSDSPFVFIWDQDVAEIIYQGMMLNKSGVFNLAGDGKVTNVELAKLLGKPLIKIPASLLRVTLAVLKKFKLTQYGPEQVGFLQYRPVLNNQRLKSVFEFTPRFSSIEVLKRYIYPERRFYLRKIEDPFILRALDIFISGPRLDELLYWPSLIDPQNQQEALDWLSFFEGQKAGTMYLVNQDLKSIPSVLINHPQVKIISSHKAQKILHRLRSNKSYHSLSDQLYSEHEISTTL